MLWFCIAIAEIFVVTCSILNDKKSTQKKKRRSVAVVWGFSALVIAVLLIIDNSYILANLMK